MSSIVDTSCYLWNYSIRVLLTQPELMLSIEMKNYSKLIIIEAGIILQTQIIGKIIGNNS
jgi:hypothetical protein